MRARLPARDDANLALGVLRASLLIVILVSEQLIDASRLSQTAFFPVLGAAGAYAVCGIVLPGGAGRLRRVFTRAQPLLDVLFLVSLAYTSGGAFSDARKAFFVIPLAAAFSESPRSTARWSLLAVGGFTLQAVAAGAASGATSHSWQQVTINQDLYLAWTGAAATMLAAGLRRRSAHTQALSETRQRLIAQAIQAVDRERARLAAALHDVPVQNLIAARHDLRRAERSADPDSFQRLHAALENTITELREEIFNLHPHALDHLGLGAALEQVARRHKGSESCTINIDVEPAADGPHRDVLFALGRELLGNAVKHADAQHVRVHVRVESDVVSLDVADDGRGIPRDRIHQALREGHIGLAAVRERVASLQGYVSIDTCPAGTTVRVTLPRSDDRRTIAADISDGVTGAVAPGMTPA